MRRGSPVSETFSVEDGHLLRAVVPQRGAPYVHRCAQKSFEQVAHAAEEHGEDGFTLESLAMAEDLPFTQVAVAVAFLKERGCITIRYRRNYPASSFLYEDAMIEYWALAEKT